MFSDESENLAENLDNDLDELKGNSSNLEVSSSESAQNTIKDVEYSSEPKELKTNSKNEDNKVTVRFIHSVPKFAGLDLEVYGPFQEGDEIEFPEQVAKVLIKKGHAIK